MFRNIKISSRLLLLIAIQVASLVAITMVALIGLRDADHQINALSLGVADQAEISSLAEQVRTKISTAVNDLSAGNVSWEQGHSKLASAQEDFDKRWRSYLSKLDPLEAEFVSDLHGPSVNKIGTAFETLLKLTENRQRPQFELFVANSFGELIEPYFDALQARALHQQANAQILVTTAKEHGQLFVFGGLLISVFGILISGIVGTLVYRSIVRPVSHMAYAIGEVSEGNYEARTDVGGRDELGELGRAFDQLLAERVAGLADVQRENEQLNTSIISLLQAVFQLSQRDLTVKVPVTEDVTGPVADALNLLTNETARVLTGVTRLSEDVASASNQVKAQSDKVIKMAEVERAEVDATAAELGDAARSMRHIAELAQACNIVADNAIQSTQTALDTVTNTVTGINSTRETIRETEKRIKRLGDRSQEINGIVNIINTIAERTHILALNASMHAASAGEAGRGFAVVANEVQRLAENAREATSQIATLVSNIQAETAETVSTMNMAITQVVEGSQLAEQAGVQMQDTQSTTSELVAAVQQIAANSQKQADISSGLLDRAEQIRRSTQETSEQLSEQIVHTGNLVDYAKGLVDSVGVFTLPEEDEGNRVAESGDAQAA